jgi:hypothetical protein
MGAAVNQASRCGEIVIDQGLLEFDFLRLDEGGEKVRSNPRLIRLFGLCRERRDADDWAEFFVIAASGQLDEPPTFEVRAIGWPAVTQIRPMIVQIEALTTWTGIESRYSLADRNEPPCLGTDSGKCGKHDW